MMLTLGRLRGVVGAELMLLNDCYGIPIGGSLSSLLVEYDSRGEPLPHKPPVIDIGRPIRTVVIEPSIDPVPGREEPDSEGTDD